MRLCLIFVASIHCVIQFQVRLEDLCCGSDNYSSVVLLKISVKRKVTEKNRVQFWLGGKVFLCE